MVRMILHIYLIIAFLIFIVERVHGQQPPIYTPRNDVQAQLRLDIDVAFLWLMMQGGLYSTANSIYSNGQNSVIDGETKSLKFWASSHSSGYPASFRSYYKTNFFADQYISSAVNGTDMFSGEYKTVPKARAIAVWRAIQLLVLPSLVLDHLSDAISSCRAGDDDEALLLWDSAWAYFMGTTEASVSIEPGTGYMLYSDVEHRCYQSCQCSQEGDRSPLNAQILNTFILGQNQLISSNCDNAEIQRAKIEQYFIIIFTQGTIRALARNIPGSLTPSVQRVEDFSYILAILPEVSACNANLATRLRSNLDFTSSNYLTENYLSLLGDLQNTYSCLGVNCADVNGFCQLKAQGGGGGRRRRQLYELDGRVARRLSSSHKPAQGGMVWSEVVSGCSFVSSSTKSPTRLPTTRQVSPTKSTSPTNAPGIVVDQPIQTDGAIVGGAVGGSLAILGLLGLAVGLFALKKGETLVIRARADESQDVKD